MTSLYQQFTLWILCCLAAGAVVIGLLVYATREPAPPRLISPRRGLPSQDRATVQGSGGADRPSAGTPNPDTDPDAATYGRHARAA